MKSSRLDFQYIDYTIYYQIEPTLVYKRTAGHPDPGAALGSEQSWQAKARWILLGHRNPDAAELSPTPPSTTVMLTPQIIASLRYELFIMDVTSSCGQSDFHERGQGPLNEHAPGASPSIPWSRSSPQSMGWRTLLQFGARQ